ncbi:MAG: OmpH family outer membrane protein [Armatimonadetes bacterium]|nr:OmpH family outer membrane protein [Armatimonadota bacterium]
MTPRVFVLGIAAFALITGGGLKAQAAEGPNAQTPNAAPAPAPNPANTPNAAPPANPPATPPASASPTAPAFALGYVDLTRIGREYEGTKVGQAELDTFQQSLRKQLDDREAVRFLDDRERGEVEKLRAVASPTDEQKKQLSDFLATSRSREAQLRALQQNPNKSDTEKADADRLTRLSAKTDEELDALGEKLEEQLQVKGDEISKRLTDSVSVAIEAVAKDKGYLAIVDKKAMLYGGIDVTEEVLRQLNKK